MPEFSFLRHKVDAPGIHTTRDKARAIVEETPPTLKESLQAFLGPLAFYDGFLESHRFQEFVAAPAEGSCLDLREDAQAGV